VPLVDPVNVSCPLVPAAAPDCSEPVDVRFPPDIANPPVALDTVILAVPSNDTPPIVLAVWRAVAVPALPPMERLATDVVEVTTSGAVPMAMVEVS